MFTTSSCKPCSTISPIFEDIVNSRRPSVIDSFAAIAYAEADLSSPDESNGKMSDLGVEWGVTSLPTLIGFGGRRAERVTDRITDIRNMSDRSWVEDWIDDQMKKGDPSPKGGSNSLWSKIFGS